MLSRCTGWIAVALASAFVVLTAGCSSDGASGASPGSSAAASSTDSGPGDSGPGGSGPGTYLALGDSVPFGFRGGGMAEFSDPADFVG